MTTSGEIAEKCSLRPHITVLYNLNFLYAYGNTPPVDLTPALPQKSDEKSVQKEFKTLLLGCGDLRSVLFTCHNNASGADIWKELRLDVVACDISAVVQARNALCLQLLLDGVDIVKSGDSAAFKKHIASLWNIWYNLVIPNGFTKVPYCALPALITVVPGPVCDDDAPAAQRVIFACGLGCCSTVCAAVLRCRHVGRNEGRLHVLAGRAGQAAVEL